MKKLEGKKLLVIGGASQHCKVVEAAHRLGAIVYVADYLADSPAKKIADHACLIDIKAIDELAALCAAEKIDGALATSLDACSVPYQQLCERMGYPCFGTAEQYATLTQKNLFKACCEKYGVDTIPSYSLEQIRSGEAEYPVFVKPVDSRGSRGQAICFNREEALCAVEKALAESASGQVLIEKYMGDCPDFTVSYLVVDGEAIPVRTGDRFEGPRGSGLENLCIASCSPSKYTDAYMEGVHHKVSAMLKGMGLKNALAFFQGFIDGDTVRFYDPGPRFAGGEYERLARQATGIDLMELLVTFALTGEMQKGVVPQDYCKLGGKYLIQLDPNLRTGKIGTIRGLEQIRENPCVLYISQRYAEGDLVPEANDLRQRFAEFAILSDSLEQEVENIRFVQNTLKILDENGENMIVYPFDTGNLL